MNSFSIASLSDTTVTLYADGTAIVTNDKHGSTEYLQRELTKADDAIKGALLVQSKQTQLTAPKVKQYF